jgi:hypothetical protein
MRVYTVHIRRPITDADRDVVLVKEGFSWPAFFFSVIWALWHRLWLIAAAFAAVEVGWNWLGSALGASGSTKAAVSFGISLLIGLFANDLRRWTLAGRRYVDHGVVAGRDADAAAQRFLDQRPAVLTELAV